MCSWGSGPGGCSCQSDPLNHRSSAILLLPHEAQSTDRETRGQTLAAYSFKKERWVQSGGGTTCRYEVSINNRRAVNMLVKHEGSSNCTSLILLLIEFRFSEDTHTHTLALFIASDRATLECLVYLALLWWERLRWFSCEKQPEWVIYWIDWNCSTLYKRSGSVLVLQS